MHWGRDWKEKSGTFTAENTAIVIPAHMGSKRFPGKPLAVARGKPLLQWACETAAGAQCASTRMVATDSKEIRYWCRQNGVTCHFEDRVQFPTGSDRVARAVANLKQIRAVINLQCDEPELTGQDLDRLMEEIQYHRHRLAATYAFDIAAYPSANLDENAVKVVTDRNHQALYFSRMPLRGARIHVGVYAYRLKCLQSFARAPRSPLEELESLEQLRLLHQGLPIHVVDLGRRVVSINTPEDLKDWEHAA